MLTGIYMCLYIQGKGDLAPMNYHMARALYNINQSMGEGGERWKTGKSDLQAVILKAHHVSEKNAMLSSLLSPALT